MRDECTTCAEKSDWRLFTAAVSLTAIRQCVVVLAFDGLAVLGHVELVDKPLTRRPRGGTATVVAAYDHNINAADVVVRLIELLEDVQFTGARVAVARSRDGLS